MPKMAHQFFRLQGLRMSKNKIFLLTALMCSSALTQAPSGNQEQAKVTSGDAATPVSATQADQDLINNVVTVDDLIKSGKLNKEPQKKRSVLPAEASFSLAGLPEMPGLDGPPGAVKTALEQKQTSTHTSNPSLSLLGVYVSHGQSRAAIDVDGVRKTYAPGDFLYGGWKLLNVNANGVDLERCHKKKCSARFLFLND
jgi:hypothetical protein